MLSRGDPISNQVEFFVTVLNGDLEVSSPGELVEKNIRSPFEKAMESIRKSTWQFFEASTYKLGLKSKFQRWEPHQTDFIEVDEIEKKVSRWKEVLA